MPKKILLTVLIVSFLFEVYRTVEAFLNPRWILDLFKIPLSDGAITLAHITAWFLLLVSALIVLGFEWIRKNNRDGLILAFILGLWWIGIGVGIYVVGGITQNLIADSAKGLVICTLIYVQDRQPQNNSRPGKTGAASK